MRTTIEMAREAGLRDCTCNGTKGCLERFTEIVRADERARMAEQPAQQEPVAWARNLTDPQPHCVTDLKYMSVADTDAGVQYTPLYTSPPAQRKPLDAGEISRLWKQHTSEDGPHHNPYDDDGLGFARAIEAKLKEKNT